MATSEKVLIIEDEPDIRDLLRDTLKDEGYEVIVANDGVVGLLEARKHLPNLVLLDQRLPGMPGAEVCRELRQDRRTQGIPIIFLTGKTEKTDVVVGLGIGADDYVTKPFDRSELLARIGAVLRRARAAKGEEKAALAVGDLKLDSAKLEVDSPEGPVVLSVVEFRILWALAEQPGVVLSRDQILDRVNRGETAVVDRTVDVHINSIRKKLGKHSAVVETVRGAGYRFKDA